MNPWLNMGRRIQQGIDAKKRASSWAAMKAAKLDPKDIASIRNVADQIDRGGFKSAAKELRTRANHIEQGFR